MIRKKNTQLPKQPPKEKGKGKMSTSRGGKKKQVTVVIDEKWAPDRFGVVLPRPEAEARWANLCLLDHKQCRFLHMPTINTLGIANNLLSITNTLGLTRLFTADWYAYRILTLEFLSTVEVESPNGTPRQITFQLGNEPRELDVDELNDIILGPADGSFVGSHDLPTASFWKKICLMQVKELPYYNSHKAKAMSIRNPL